MNWGKWIILSFILFALFIGGLVVVCMRQKISLVSKNYYQDELAYQQQIDRLNNANQLQVKPNITVSGNVAEINFERFNELEKGELVLYRPSDDKFDRRFALRTSDQKLEKFDLGLLPRGMYRARMRWVMKGKEYFIESVVNI